MVDGLGSWTGDNELCITQEGHTPFIGQWTTTTNWTKHGAPYLWWTGPDQASILSTLVTWAKGAKLVGGTRKVAIVAGDRASDQTALKDYLLPDLKRAGIPKPMIETIPAGASDTAATGAAAPLIVQRLQAAGINIGHPPDAVQRHVPLPAGRVPGAVLPEAPAVGLRGLHRVVVGADPATVRKGAQRAGGRDGGDLGRHRRAQRREPGGYDPGVANCYKVWHAAYPKPIPGQTLIHGEKASPYIEEQGPIAGWCQGVELFARRPRRPGAT